MPLLLMFLFHWCSESEWVSGCVPCFFVMLARLGSLYSAHRSVSSVVAAFGCRMTPNSSSFFLLIIAWNVPDFHIRVFY